MVTLKVADLMVYEELSDTDAAAIVGGYSVGEWWNDFKEGADVVGDVIKETWTLPTHTIPGSNTVIFDDYEKANAAIDKGILGV